MDTDNHRWCRSSSLPFPTKFDFYDYVHGLHRKKKEKADWKRRFKSLKFTNQKWSSSTMAWALPEDYGLSEVLSSSVDPVVTVLFLFIFLFFFSSVLSPRAADERGWVHGPTHTSSWCTCLPVYSTIWSSQSCWVLSFGVVTFLSFVFLFCQFCLLLLASTSAPFELWFDELLQRNEIFCFHHAVVNSTYSGPVVENSNVMRVCCTG